MPLAHVLCEMLSRTRMTVDQLLSTSDIPPQYADESSVDEVSTPGKSSAVVEKVREFPRVQDAIDFLSDQLGVDKVKVLEAILLAAKHAAEKP